MSELRKLHVKDIKVGTRFRKEYKNLESLKASIKDKGIVQPITVNKNIELVAGGRRYAAAAALLLEGITVEVPALIRDTDDELDLRECELIENIEREDLTWQEEVALTERIHELQIEKHGPDWSGRKTADMLGKSVGGTAQNLSLAKAMNEVPELKKVKNKKDVLKLLRQTAEQLDTEEKREAQKHRLAMVASIGATEREMHSNLKRADTNFKIMDCFEGMREFNAQRSPESPVVMIEVDPPYAIDLAVLKKKEGITNDDLKRYKEISKENYPSFLTNLCGLLYESAAPDTWCIFWFGPTWFTETKDALINAGFKVDDIPGIWLKGDDDSEGTGQTNSPATYLARAYETFFIARKGSPKIRKQGRSNVFSFKPVPSGQKYHPTQRPIELIKEILNTFAYPGAVCMVPFLGSGTTLRAIYKADMNGFGWELNKENKDYFMLEVEKDDNE